MTFVVLFLSLVSFAQADIPQASKYEATSAVNQAALSLQYPVSVVALGEKISSSLVSMVSLVPGVKIVKVYSQRELPQKRDGLFLVKQKEYLFSIKLNDSQILPQGLYTGVEVLKVCQVESATCVPSYELKMTGPYDVDSTVYEAKKRLDAEELSRSYEIVMSASQIDTLKSKFTVQLNLNGDGYVKYFRQLYSMGKIEQVPTSSELRSIFVSWARAAHETVWSRVESGK